MARKNLLQGLTETIPPEATIPPRRDRGAIGAVSRSIADLQARALVEVPADMIDAAGLVDRLDADEDLARLVESIRDYGQQVPVLLRHSPNVEGRYEVVYGRRRVAAIKQLGLPVRAMLRELNDHDLIVAQGQENAARKDLSFIEKASFAQQMVAMKFDRKTICDALHIDKTVISRMLSVTDAVAPDVIRAIGAAPAVGRDRWLTMAERVKGRSIKELVKAAQGETSDLRFEAVLNMLKPPAPPRAAPARLTSANGRELGQITKTARKTTLALKREDGFDDWLIENFDRIHREFLGERGE